MTDQQAEAWTPADNPYAIAFSQAQWAWWSVSLFVDQARSADGVPQQIYARQVPHHLRAMVRSARMMQVAIAEEGVAELAQAALTRAIAEFDAAVPGVKAMRDMAAHFDEYARGEAGCSVP